MISLYLLKSSISTSSFLTLVFASLFLISLGTISHNAFADTVTATISVTGTPEASAVNPDTNRIYVTSNSQSALVSVIDGTDNKIINTVSFGTTPNNSVSGIAVNPVTNRIYVEDGSGIGVIDGNTNTVIDTIPLSTGGFIAVNPNTNKIYVAIYPNNSVSVIDGSTDKVINTIQTCGPIGDFSVNSVTNKMYVPCYGSFSGTYSGTSPVQVINASSGTVTKTINFTGYSWPENIAINPITNTAYLISSNMTIYVIDGNADSVTGKINGVSGGIGGLAVNSNTSKVYATDPGTNAVSIINGTSNQIIQTLTVGNDPLSSSVNPNTDQIYVVNWKSGTISVIDGSTFSTTNTVPSSPQNLQTTAHNTQVTLSWMTPSSNGGSPITNYNIYRGTSSGSETLLDTIGNVTSYNDITVTNGQQYFYKVAAVNSIGESSQSNEASATPIAPATTPSAPTGLAATTTSSSEINLSWTAPVNNGGSAITGYMIERSLDSGTTWSTVVANTNSISTAYSDTGLAASTTYTYRVSAINSAGTSAPSNAASVTTSVSTTKGIALSNTQFTSGTVSPSNIITISNFNVGSDDNRLLVVGVSANNNDVASVTFGGISLQNIAYSFYNNDAEFWYLKNPSGTGDITVTMNGPTQAVVGAYAFSGVNQTLPIPTHVVKHNASPNSPKISITTKYANDWVLDLPSIYGGSTFSSPTCTQQWYVNVPNAITGASSSIAVPTAGVVTCSWTASSDDMWDDAAIEINAASR